MIKFVSFKNISIKKYKIRNTILIKIKHKEIKNNGILDNYQIFHLL
jgi:hypothetical protein